MGGNSRAGSNPALGIELRNSLRPPVSARSLTAILGWPTGSREDSMSPRLTSVVLGATLLVATTASAQYTTEAGRNTPTGVDTRILQTRTTFEALYSP